MTYKAINPDHLRDQITEFWSPKIIAQMNDYYFKLAKIHGDFVWHSHSETDETFMVLDGSLLIQFRDGEVRLEKGELFVVPKGVEHRPVADSECMIMLIEPTGTVNTGDAGGDLTASDQWLNQLDQHED